MNQASLFLLVCLVPVAFFAILARYRTGLVGLSFLNAALVASSSFAAFFFGSSTGLDMDWFTEAHAGVVKCSVAGCLAMAAGLFLAWWPLSSMRNKSRWQKGAFPPATAWINPTFGWATFGFGVSATLSLYVLGQVPTVSTALYGLQNLTRFGIFVLLLVALQSGRWSHFVAAVGLALPILVAGALRSGHTPLSVSLLVPVALILAFYRRTTIYSLLVISMTGLIYLHLMNAWMSTRGIIRSGELSQQPLWQQARIFIPAFVERLGSGKMSAEDTQTMLLERVDMSDLLAQQLMHQPDHEPYARGETFLGAFAALVPRVLWPGKPILAGGSEFVKRFTGITRAEEDTTSIGLPYQFELYANGGPWLVVIGLFAIGYISGRAELRLFQNVTSLRSVWGLVVVTLLICDGGQRADVTIPSIISGGLSAWAAGWFLERVSPDFARRLLTAVPGRDSKASRTSSAKTQGRPASRRRGQKPAVDASLP